MRYIISSAGIHFIDDDQVDDSIPDEQAVKVMMQLSREIEAIGYDVTPPDVASHIWDKIVSQMTLTVAVHVCECEVIGTRKCRQCEG